MVRLVSSLLFPLTTLHRDTHFAVSSEPVAELVRWRSYGFETSSSFPWRSWSTEQIRFAAMQEWTYRLPLCAWVVLSWRKLERSFGE